LFFLSLKDKNSITLLQFLLGLFHTVSETNGKREPAARVEMHGRASLHTHKSSFIISKQYQNNLH
ncbi:hypothetical protein, partial [Parabacteroides sp. AF48-14]|uniref:hypothetical protein n=1 Tax=Parabacteroides sp. AF48-14 TaxID=2292052 RepID=UPI001F41F587